MRVMHYAGTLSRSAGGLHASVPGLAKAQAAAGATVLVCGGADAAFEGDKAVWGALPLTTHPARPGGYGLDARAFSALRRFRPEVLHIHGLWSAASLYGLAAAVSGFTVVVSPRGMLDPWILARRPRLKALHAAFAERPLLKRAVVHALSDAEAAAVGAFEPQVRQVVVIGNGVSAPEAAPLADTREGVLYLGRLHPKKQVLELVEAWGRLSCPRPRLTIAGWGDVAYEAALSAAVARTPDVAFVGGLYGEAKAAALRKARFFILPSLSEGVPMAVLEALAAGAIPIITDACNLPELTQAGVALRIAEDLSDLSPVVEAASRRSPSSLNDMAARGVAFAERYSWNGVAARMLDIYRDALRERRA
jgi:glycosyltransferase involved in cell wall biosynthesis